jgi:alpha-galactosidase
LNIAKSAKELGVELFVLDDGWFGKRNDDTTSLGDWYENVTKLHEGLAGLAGKMNRLGLKFGLWFEPEMVSPKSHLYREHPDWAVGLPHLPHTLGRNQLVLDFSRSDVVDYLYEKMADMQFYFGDELMQIGIQLPTEFNGANGRIAERGGDYQSHIFYLKRTNGVNI